ncbi:MAG: helix-turn-helix domain-containing protein [Acetatifactor sp.]|nr:helix-turn-helix domain-containing protein [Acetatifactor sp.]
MNHQEMGMRIKFCRKARKITQAQLAEAAKVSPHYIYEVERGIKSPSIEVMADISDALQTSLDYLINGTMPNQMDYAYTDRLNELLIDLTIPQRDHLHRVLKSLIPYLKL